MKKILIIFAILVALVIMYLFSIHLLADQSDKAMVGKVKNLLVKIDDYHKENKLYPTTEEFESKMLPQENLVRRQLQYYSFYPYTATSTSQTQTFLLTYQLNKQESYAIGTMYVSGCASPIECGGYKTNYQVTADYYAQYLSK